MESNRRDNTKKRLAFKGGRDPTEKRAKRSSTQYQTTKKETKHEGRDHMQITEKGRTREKSKH